MVISIMWSESEKSEKVKNVKKSKILEKPSFKLEFQTR